MSNPPGYMQAYYAANREALRAKSAEKYRDDPEFRAASNRRGKKYRKELKDHVVAGYGGICTCCGESNPAFLSIDHVEGGGRKHRASLGGGVGLYLDIIKREFPDDMQLLCYNCNLGRAYNEDVCPHKLLLAAEHVQRQGANLPRDFGVVKDNAATPGEQRPLKAGAVARGSCTGHRASSTRLRAHAHTVVAGGVTESPSPLGRGGSNGALAQSGSAPATNASAIMGCMRPSEQGDRTEAVVLSFLARAGYTVLVPFGVARYDMAIDPRDGSGIKTVQCKTGRLDRGCIVFRTHSLDRQTRVRKSYRGEIDYFGMWCPAMPEAAYLVPVNEVPETMGWLRVESPRNKQVEKIKWASQYEIKGL